MGISLKGVNLGYMGLDMSLLVEKPELQNVPYQCPAIAYIIEHPDGRILWETGISTRAKDEWLAVWQDLVARSERANAGLGDGGLHRCTQRRRSRSGWRAGNRRQDGNSPRSSAGHWLAIAAANGI